MQHPEGAILTIEDIKELIEKAKREGPIDFYLAGYKGGQIRTRVCAENSYINDNLDFFYSERDGSSNGINVRDIPHEREGRYLYMFLNYWNAYAYALKQHRKPANV